MMSADREKIDYVPTERRGGVIDTAVVRRVDRSPRHAVEAPTERSPRTIATPAAPPQGYRGDDGYRDEQSTLPPEYFQDDEEKFGRVRNGIIAATGIGSAVQGIARSITAHNSTTDMILRVTNVDPWDKNAIPRTAKESPPGFDDDLFPREKRPVGRPKKKGKGEFF